MKAGEDGYVVISIGGHEMGQGIRTALANAVSRKLGVPAEKVRADKCRGKAQTSRQALHVELLGRCALLPSRRR